VGELTPLQEAILADDGACVVRGLVQRVSVDNTAYTTLGPWRTGELSLSVRSENKIGYYDRVTLIDAVIAYDEVILTPETGDTLPLRYRAISVNGVFSTTARYEEECDFRVTDAGAIVWNEADALPRNERLAVHYLTHPAYLVLERPHAMRMSTAFRKITNRRTPHGNPQELPLQAMMRLEFLRDS